MNMNRMVLGGCTLFIFLVLTDLQAVAANDFKKPVEYAPIHVTDLKPTIISLERLKKGLSSVYYLEYFERNLDDISTTATAKYRQLKGKPIIGINHQFDKEEVFDSGTNRGVAMRMTGYLHVTEKGDYQFQALSNDGVRVMLAGSTIVNDSEQHSDRLSNIGYAVIDHPGYYEIIVEYFQRKGTAALKLFWKTPEGDGFVPIPENVYVHLP